MRRRARLFVVTTVISGCAAATSAVPATDAGFREFASSEGDTATPRNSTRSPFVVAVYGQATIDGFPVNFTPCYAIATKGRFGGVISGIGTLLKGQDVPSAAKAVVEIYKGKSATGKC